MFILKKNKNEIEGEIARHEKNREQEETKISGYWQGISIPTVYINIQKEK